MKYVTVPVVMFCLLFMTGCSMESVRQGLYEGARTHNDLQQTPSERLGKPAAPDYPEYQRARQEQND